MLLNGYSNIIVGGICFTSHGHPAINENTETKKVEKEVRLLLMKLYLYL